MIPKTIHCCWFGKADKTPLAKKCIASWRRFASGWEIREWGQQDVEKLSPPPFFKDAIQARKWAFASDWARFAIISAEGGVYLDCDVELVAPIDDLIEEGPFFALSSNEPSWVDPGIGFAAEKNDAVCSEIENTYRQIVFDPACHLNQTAPAITNRILNKYPSRRRLPAEYFNPKGNCAGEINITPETRAIHHFAASWFNWKQRLAYIIWPNMKRLISKKRHSILI